MVSIKVVSKLMGGLGNQMLQYATGFALSKQLHATHLVDVNYFNIDASLNNTHREFELKVFGITNGLYSGVLSHQLTRKIVFKISWLRLKLLPLFGIHYVREVDDFAALKKIQRGMVYLDGYWQSYLFFHEQRQQLSKVFNFLPLMQGENALLVQHINASNAVAVHIRRTDYLLPESIHLAMDVDYYQRAMTHIKESNPDAVFYFFGDDEAWIREHFNIDNKTCYHVNHNKGAQSFLDMGLMCLCKHNIISNSTFSWWAAFLNTNPNQICIAPKQWFKPGVSVAFSPSAFIPETWITV